MSFRPRLDLPVRSTCYHGGRAHENGYGYVDDIVIDRMLKDEEDKVNIYLEKMQYASAPPPLGWKYRVPRTEEHAPHPGRHPMIPPVTSGVTAHHPMGDGEEDLMETHDDELILEDDDEMDEDDDDDMDMDDEVDMGPPPPAQDQRRRASLPPRNDDELRVGPIQTVSLTTFLASPIEAPLIRPPQRYLNSAGSYDSGGSAPHHHARRRYSLPRTSPLDFPMGSYPHHHDAADTARRSSILSTGSSVEFRQTPTRRFSFSSPATSVRSTPAAANMSLESIVLSGGLGDDAPHASDTPTNAGLSWDYSSLR
ncbi:Aste57867_11172 [Aphanomyces stellatus]|uniref:Aste57867_11172 protein n=1 Tax=Aphanomyces stellatus TaxID=120398 RepID=A0A485KSN0_9STRA|nr:hypothetical protein As57867_011130 [Aphanomyces stellatus]VFT88039.1 Aste57867_11172 [Aphanomyces stellatus]